MVAGRQPRLPGHVWDGRRRRRDNPRQGYPDTLLAPAAVDRRDPQPGVARLERVHPLVDGHARPIHSPPRAAPVAVAGDVLDRGTTEQRFHALSVLWAALAERELPRRVLQDLGQQRSIDSLEIR